MVKFTNLWYNYDRIIKIFLILGRIKRKRLITIFLIIYYVNENLKGYKIVITYFSIVIFTNFILPF